MTPPATQTPRRVVPADRARQGEATGHVRYVLAGSLTLAVLAGVFFWVFNIL